MSDSDETPLQDNAISSSCPKCGSEMVRQADGSFCPVCLMKQGMQPSTYGAAPDLHGWQPPTMEALAAKFPNLRIESLIGKGGMGAVYKVQQIELGRTAALKVLPEIVSDDAGFTERFLREARLLASLSHPHIVTVYEFGQRDGTYFLLMEYVDGVTLRQATLADTTHKLASREALEVVEQLCDALQFAHDEGVIHRDIKPENILIDKRGRVKIADFGLARLLGKPADLPTLTKTHQLLGTPVYMAPEQMEGHAEIDHRADIYSLGVVFYELLTGELPLGRFQPPSAKTQLDARLDEVVLRTLEKEPQRRYQQASEIRTDMNAIQHSVTTPPVSSRHTVSRSIAAWLGLLAGVALCLIAINIPAWMEQQDNDGVFAVPKPSRIHIRIPENTPPTSRHPGEMNGGRIELLSEVDERYEVGDFSEGSDGMMGMGFPIGTNSEIMGGSASGYESGYETASSEILVWERTETGPPIPKLADQFVQSLHITKEIAITLNQILSDTHQHCKRLESSHLYYSPGPDGELTVTLQLPPDAMEVIHSQMWQRIDDAAPIGVQRALRSALPLWHSEDGASSPPPMATATNKTAEGFSSGVLGWGNFGQGISSVKLKFTREGRWYRWKTEYYDANDHLTASTVSNQTHPVLPPVLQPYYSQPAPWMTVWNIRMALRHQQDWPMLAQYFTTTAQFDLTLATWLSLDQQWEPASASSGELAFWNSRYSHIGAADSANAQSSTVLASPAWWLAGDAARSNQVTPFDVIRKLSDAKDDTEKRELLDSRLLDKSCERIRNRMIYHIHLLNEIDQQNDPAAFFAGELAPVPSTSNASLRLDGVIINNDEASAVLKLANGTEIPLEFRLQKHQWKIHRILTPGCSVLKSRPFRVVAIATRNLSAGKALTESSSLAPTLDHAATGGGGYPGTEMSGYREIPPAGTSNTYHGMFATNQKCLRILSSTSWDFGT